MNHTPPSNTHTPTHPPTHGGQRGNTPPLSHGLHILGALLHLLSVEPQCVYRVAQNGDSFFIVPYRPGWYGQSGMGLVSRSVSIVLPRW